MKQERYYQTEAIKASKDFLQQGFWSQLLTLPTGCGKTYTAIQITKDFQRILWLSHTEELIEQSANAWVENAGYEVGIVKAEKFDIDKRVVMGSAQTMHRRLERLSPDYFDCIVADECDLFLAETFKKTLDYFKPKLLLGLSATPYRADGVPLEDMFQKTIYEYTIEQAVADGFLCKPDAIKVKTSCNLDGVHTLAGEFNQKELTEKVNTLERNNAIANKYLEYASGRQFIAFCVDVQHAIDLCETFNEKGVKCEYVVGDKKLTTDRKGVIDGFKNGEYEGLTNCFVLVAGFDHPNTGCLIMACPTKSKRKFIQQVGRGLRLKDDEFVSKFGQNCIILDVVDVSSKHRVINTDELDKYKNTEDKLFMPQWEKDRIAQKKLERMMSEVAVEEKIELFPLPKVKFQRAFNSKEPATEAQLYLLKHRGYDVVNNIYTKGMVNEILMTESASLEDIRNLQSAGYDVSNGVTFAEAKLAYQEIQRRDKK